MLDIDDWMFYVEMLSVENTYNFAADLKLPLSQHEQKQALRLARGSLEAYFFSSVRRGENVDQPQLISAWKNYRQGEKVLSDDILSAICDYYKKRYEISILVFSGMANLLSDDIFNNLIGWFKNCFPSVSNQYGLWPWILKRLFLDQPQCTTISLKRPLTNVELQCIEKFCSSYSIETYAIDWRFEEINNQYQVLSASPWEDLVRAFPVDGPDKSCFWISSIGRCLNFIKTKALWNDLEKELGIDSMSYLIQTAKELAIYLPGHCEVPPPLSYQQTFEYD